MRGFLGLLVFAAAGLFGVLQWRKSLQALRAPVVAPGEAAKAGKAQRRRHRRGARRLSRNEVRNDVFVASAPADETPVGAGTSPSPVGDGTNPVFAPPSEEPAPLAPGGASTTERPPSPDILGELAPAAAPSPSSSGGRPQPFDEPQ